MGSLVALNTAGSTPYFAGQHCYIDMLGLNDPRFAQDYALFRAQLDQDGAEIEGGGLVFTYYQRIQKP